MVTDDKDNGPQDVPSDETGAISGGLTHEDHDRRPAAPPEQDVPVEGRKLRSAQAAELVGVNPSTWRGWRAHGRPRPTPVPESDGWFEMQAPWWWVHTIIEWNRARQQSSSAPMASAPEDPQP